MVSPSMSTYVHPLVWNFEILTQSYHKPIQYRPLLSAGVKEQTHPQCPTTHTQHPLKFQFQVDYGPRSMSIYEPFGLISWVF